MQGEVILGKGGGAGWKGGMEVGEKKVEKEEKVEEEEEGRRARQGCCLILHRQHRS